MTRLTASSLPGMGCADMIIVNTADVWNARIDLFLALGGDWGTDLSVPEPDPAETTETQAKSENPKSKIRNPKFEEVL